MRGTSRGNFIYRHIFLTLFTSKSGRAQNVKTRVSTQRKCQIIILTVIVAINILIFHLFKAFVGHQSKDWESEQKNVRKDNSKSYNNAHIHSCFPMQPFSNPSMTFLLSLTQVNKSISNHQMNQLN